jgi:hypothetical protein
LMGMMWIFKALLPFSRRFFLSLGTGLNPASRMARLSGWTLYELSLNVSSPFVFHSVINHLVSPPII